MTKQQTFEEKSFSVAGFKLWNSFPEYLKTSEDMDTFKHKLKTYLFRCEFLYTVTVWYSTLSTPN